MEKYRAEDESSKVEIEAKNGLDNRCSTMRDTPQEEKLQDKFEDRDEETVMRELVSSGSDAMGQNRYELFTDIKRIEVQPGVYFKIVPDKTESTIAIEDDNIGMTKSGQIHSLGTIAESGTKAFPEAMVAGGDISSSGQFEIGFCCAWLVSDEVGVISKNNDFEQCIRESGVGGSVAVQQDAEMVRGEIQRGPNIISRLKEDQAESLEKRRLTDPIMKYSEVAGLLIELHMEKVQGEGGHGFRGQGEGEEG